METIRAVFEGGVFRPMGPVDMPEHSLVDFEPRPVEPADSVSPGPDAEPVNAGDDPDLDAVYEILSRRYRTGRRDRAARHDEHQP